MQSQELRELSKKLQDNLSTLVDKRKTWEEHWQQVSSYCLPRKAEVTQERSPGDKRHVVVFDNTAISALELLASSLHGTLTSSANRWFALRFREPALNDITYREAIEIGLNKICNVISNGVIGPLPGTVLSRCSEEFLKVFYSVDLVISKGGGNFESLLNEKNLPENTCFMLMCKCNVHSKIFNLPVGKGIIYFHNI